MKIQKSKTETRIPVYMTAESKKELEKLKFDIWNLSGHSVSLSRIIRDLLEDQLQKHREELISKYSDKQVKQNE